MALIDSKNEWQELTRHSPFLQSWEWGEFQAAAGSKIWRIGIREKGQLLTGALVVKRSLPLGVNYLYVPRGFVCPKEKWTELEQELLSLAKAEKSVFIKVEPLEPLPFPHARWKWLRGKAVQPENTLVLDLDKSEEELLAGMHQKTRYNIRLAERKGVRTEFSSGPEAVEVFLKLSREVEARSGFGFHPDEYYRKMQSVLSPAGMFEIGLAYKDNEPLAAHILIRYGGVTTYAHGASSSLSRSLMAPALLQWDSIKRAKDQGMRQYDFYGIAPEGEENHPWAGITRFKLGFGGRRVEYPGAFDHPVKPIQYMAYQIVRRI